MKKIILFLNLFIMLAFAMLCTGCADSNIDTSQFMPSMTDHSAVLSLSVDRTDIEFVSVGGKQEINVVADGHFSVNKTVDWLAVEQTASTIIITASANMEIEDRTASLSVSLDGTSLIQNIQVLQYGSEGVITNGYDEEKVW